LRVRLQRALDSAAAADALGQEAAQALIDQGGRPYLSAVAAAV
jgi:hypothetical protein